MPHVEPEDLALLALGEDAGTPADAAHLAECDECRTEFESLRRIVAAGRETTSDDVPTAPPPAVWERIRGELGLGGPAGVMISPPLAGTPVPEGADELAARRRRRRTAGWLAVAAAAGVVLGGLGGAWWASRSTTLDAATVVARAALEPLPGRAATGVAAVHEDETGARVVVVEIQGEVTGDGYREVWLLAPDLSGMVSLGLLEGSSGRFALPEGIDLDRYPLVDVSVEPFDGDVAHSGESIVRGSLDV